MRQLLLIYSNERIIRLLVWILYKLKLLFKCLINQITKKKQVDIEINIK